MQATQKEWTKKQVIIFIVFIIFVLFIVSKCSERNENDSDHEIFNDFVRKESWY